MAETETYSQIDIQRYLQHKMSQQEMYEFEKALMNAPFLADALDGFSAGNATLAEAHLAEIERSITGGYQTAKVVPLAPRKTAWWKVAAIIFIIISAGAITWSVVNSNIPLTNKNKEITASTPASTTIEKDSLRPVDKPVARIDITPKEQIPSRQHNTSPIISQDSFKSLAANKKINEIASDLENKTDGLIASTAPAMASNNLSPTQMRFQRAAPQNEFKGKVIDKAGEPLGLVNITTNTRGVSTISDANGNFTLKAPDTVIDVSANSPGYASVKAKINSNKPDTKIVLKEDELSLAEVVVTTLANKKKDASPTIRIDSSNSAEPVGGWKNFQQYLSKKQDFIKGIESLQNLNEDIVLEFLVDQRGQPTNIKVPEEMDKTMAEKTIEIISNGPRWKNKKKDKKVKVIIGF